MQIVCTNPMASANRNCAQRTGIQRGGCGLVNKSNTSNATKTAPCARQDTAHTQKSGPLLATLARTAAMQFHVSRHSTDRTCAQARMRSCSGSQCRMANCEQLPERNPRRFHLARARNFSGSIRRTLVICDEAMIAVEPTARSVVYDIARLGGNGRLRSTRSVGLHRAPARGGASRATVLAAIHTSRTSRYDTVCCHIVTRRSLVHTTDTLTQLVQN